MEVENPMGKLLLCNPPGIGMTRGEDVKQLYEALLPLANVSHSFTCTENTSGNFRTLFFLPRLINHLNCPITLNAINYVSPPASGIRLGGTGFSKAPKIALTTLPAGIFALTLSTSSSSEATLKIAMQLLEQPSQR